ncbi:MAG: hypothetical protein JOY71_08630 [Acetobacteraceae bacterium]|nr:hypothetical protein [Acetobacteraceae bacterium]MBV8522177.1 hypothetical protein [Acetobacteraceae bacterium]
MATHKFTIGQQVQFVPGAAEFHIPGGLYTIVRKLPVEANECQYRVKNVRDGHERILRESRLTPAAAPMAKLHGS